MKSAKKSLPIAIRDSSGAEDIVSRGWTADGLVLLAFCHAISNEREAAIQCLEYCRAIQLHQNTSALLIKHREVIVELALGRITQARRLAGGIARGHTATEPLDKWYLMLFNDPLSSLVRSELPSHRNRPGIGLPVRMVEILLEMRLAMRGLSPLLTPAESQVLQLLTLDLPNKDIAVARSSTEATIKVHVRSILRKLEASSRRAAVIIAKERGLL